MGLLVCSCRSQTVPVWKNGKNKLTFGTRFIASWQENWWPANKKDTGHKWKEFSFNFAAFAIDLLGQTIFQWRVFWLLLWRWLCVVCHWNRKHPDRQETAWCCSWTHILWILEHLEIHKRKQMRIWSAQKFLGTLGVLKIKENHRLWPKSREKGACTEFDSACFDEISLSTTNNPEKQCRCRDEHHKLVFVENRMGAEVCKDVRVVMLWSQLFALQRFDTFSTKKNPDSVCSTAKWKHFTREQRRFSAFTQISFCGFC